MDLRLHYTLIKLEYFKNIELQILLKNNSIFKTS